MIKKQTGRVVGIIPARYGSVRFPGKPLADIMGKSLIRRTYENAKRSETLEEVVVATDDHRIYEHVIEFGGEAVMTSDKCLTGTDRLADAVKNLRRLHDAELFINIQGDEPCLEPQVIDSIAEALLHDHEAVMSTAVVKIESEEEALSSSVVKCVMDGKGNALYFSRALIPSNKASHYNPQITYYKHLGIYGYRREFLLHYAELKTTPLQLAEDLEQLKVLEHGYRIKTAIVKSCGIGVDTPEDIKKVEQLLCKQNTSL